MGAAGILLDLAVTSGRIEDVGLGTIREHLTLTAALFASDWLVVFWTLRFVLSKAFAATLDVVLDQFGSFRT